MDIYYYNGDDGKPYTIKGHTNLGMDRRDNLISVKRGIVFNMRNEINLNAIILLLLLSAFIMMVGGCGEDDKPVDTTGLPTTVPSATAPVLPTSVLEETEEGGSCTLTGGEVVKEGWSGKDTGSNYCNQCMCLAAGLGCTKMACPPMKVAPTLIPMATSITASTPTWQSPKLENLLIGDLGPYDSASSTFGKLKYDMRFGEKVFDEFGQKGYGPSGNIVYNPTFKFKAPADTVLIAPISGFISYVEWQSSQGDWEIHIRQDIDSEWSIGVDHIASIECDRSSVPVPPCDLPLKIGDSVVSEYMPVKAGEVIGYVGYWSGYENIGINGMTELMVFKYINGYEGVMNYCPTMYLDEAVEEHFFGIVQELMTSFEDWSGEYSTYDEQNMVSPGCLYSATKELNDEIELIKEIQ